MQHVFVYGTLMFVEIVEGLTQHSYKSKRANLYGYKRLAVKYSDYPAIIPDHNSKVEGKLIFDIDKQALEIIIFFEGDEYEIKAVEIEFGNKKVKALAFVWGKSSDLLHKTDWDETGFKKESLNIYKKEIIPQTRMAWMRTRFQT